MSDGETTFVLAIVFALIFGFLIAVDRCDDTPSYREPESQYGYR